MARKKPRPAQVIVTIDSDVTMVPLSKIKPYEKNNKKHKGPDIEKLADHILEVGWDQPIVLDENHVILKGHKRYAAARSLNMIDAPCIIKPGLTESQKKKIRIADNRLNESEWDIENLKAELDELHELDDDFDDEELGFDDGELDALFGEDDDEAQSDALAEDDPPPAEIPMKKETRTIESNRVTTIETHTPQPQPQPGEAKPGSKEFTAGDFEKFDHVCPRCGFEFDDKK